MFAKLLRLVAPFSAIAEELKNLRELYEADLASRNPPIYRITETPKDDDTEVSYMSDKTTKKGKLHKLFLGQEDEEDEDVLNSDN